MPRPSIAAKASVRRRWFERKRCSPSLPLAIYLPLSHIGLRRCALLGGEGSPNHVGFCFGGEFRSKPLSPGSSTWCGVMSSKLRRPLVLCEGGRVAEAGPGWQAGLRCQCGSGPTGLPGQPGARSPSPGPGRRRRSSPLRALSPKGPGRSDPAFVLALGSLPRRQRRL